MKSYPSIDKIVRDTYVYTQDKLDGSNIRAEISLKKGFHKFGTRNQLIDRSHAQFGKSVDLIINKYQEDVMRILKSNRMQDACCFFEYHGPNSFAGNHDPNDVMDVTLFDVNVDKIGLIDIRDFLKMFGHLDVPAILHEGKVNSELIHAVTTSNLIGMTYEGVICKGAIDKKSKLPVMFKIKSEAWLTKLKNFCKGDEKLFNNLA